MKRTDIYKIVAGLDETLIERADNARDAAEIRHETAVFRSTNKKPLLAAAVTVVLGLVLSVLTVLIFANSKKKGKEQNAASTPDPVTEEEPELFPGLALLHDENYLVRVYNHEGPYTKVYLKPYVPERKYRQSDAMTEDAPFVFDEQADVMQPWYIDNDGNLYVHAKSTGVDDGIYAIRVLNEEEGRMLLDTEGLDQIDEYETFILMHMLAAYPRMRVYTLHPPLTQNIYFAFQSVLYFTDSHVVRCTMSQPASSYGTVIKVFPYEGNEWAEKPWLEYGEDEYEAYIKRVIKDAY